jgi:uncharacterized Zn finger protein
MPKTGAPLTEAAIKQVTPDPYFSRGLNYYRNGAVHDLTWRGQQLTAFCEGSQAEPYRVVVELEDRQVVSTSCSCPMSGGCKHVAAVLLQWAHAPETCEEREPIEVLLKNKEREELVALVLEMLKRAPELEGLLDLPMPGSKRRTTVDPESYRRQIRRVMTQAWEWEAQYSAAKEIYAVTAQADKFAEHGDWGNARLIYQAVLDEAIPHYGETQDEGEIAAAIQQAVEGLGQCLEVDQPDETTRQEILAALFDVMREDINLGGMGLGDTAELFLWAHATAEDLPEIRQWIKDEIQPAAGQEDFSRKWQNDYWGSRLLTVDERAGDVEEFLRSAQKLGLHGLLFRKLLELMRYDEAYVLAQTHLVSSPWERLQTAETLAKAGRAEEALQLAEAGLPNNTDSRLTEWVAGQYAAQHELERALTLYESVWQARPRLDLYEQLEQLGQAARQWETLRPLLLQSLTQQRAFTLKAQIYLHTQEWDAAWEAAQQEKYAWASIKLEVAHASEKERPERAIAVYTQIAEQLIKQQGRNNYQTAAEHLKNARALYKRLGQTAEWNTYIAALRASHKNKPALRQELDQAGL